MPEPAPVTAAMWWASRGMGISSVLILIVGFRLIQNLAIWNVIFAA
jgi:hypothetical protein